MTMAIPELDSTQHWPSTTILKYSYRTTLPQEYVGMSVDHYHDFQEFTDEQKQKVDELFLHLETIIPIDFQRVDQSDSESKISFGFVKGPAPDEIDNDPTKPDPIAWMVDYPSTTAFAGDIWVFNSSGLYGDISNAFLTTALHEIAHALGIQHPFMDDDHVGPVLSSVNNTKQFTVMSDKSHQNGWMAQPTVLQLYDIAALQAIYAANEETGKGKDDYYGKGISGREGKKWGQSAFLYSQ